MKKNFLCKSLSGFSFTETIVSVCIFSAMIFSVYILTRNSFLFINRIENVSLKNESGLIKIIKLQEDVSNLKIPFYIQSVKTVYSEKTLSISDENSGKIFYRFELPETVKLKKASLLYFKDSFVSGLSLLLSVNGKENKIKVHFANFFPGEIVF